MADLELFGTASCRFTSEMREDLEWRGVAYAYHDVEADPAAMERMVALTGGQRTVPVLVADGEVKEIGFRGRGCHVSLGTPKP